MASNLIMYWLLHLICLIPVIVSLSDSSIRFSINYFEETHVKHLCLLTCGKGNWHHRFAKHILLKNIAVSSVNIDENNDRSNTDLGKCLRNKLMPIGILIDLKCLKFENIVIYASKMEVLDSKHKWLIIEEKSITRNNYTVVEEDDSIRDIEVNKKNYNSDSSCSIFLYNLNLSVNADIAVAATKDLLKYNIYEVYNFGKLRNGRFIINKIGNWNFKRGLNITKTFKYYRRWDYQQMPLKVIVVVSPVPKVFDMEILLGRIPGPGVAIIQQTGTQILYEIARAHNIRFVPTVVDRWIGDYNRNHSYAANNAIHFRDVDITPILRFIPSHFDRYDVVYPPVTYVHTKYFYKIPEQGIGKYQNEFLRPLSPTTWWFVVMISVLCGIMLLMSAVVEERNMSFEFAFFSVLALICQQCLLLKYGFNTTLFLILFIVFEENEDVRRVSSARKLTILVTGFSCLVIYNYYTSSVVSWLLNGPPPSINSLWELLDSTLQPIFEDVGYVHSWLELPDYYFNKKSPKAEDELKRRVLNMQSKGIPILKPIYEGIEMVKKGGYVYHAELHAAYTKISETFTQSELCDLGSLPSMEKNLLYSCVPKNSPYREFFIWSLSRFFERGVIKCIQQRTWPQIVTCEGSSPRALALGGAAPAFILLGAGIILGIIIMVLERIKWKYDRSRE